MEKFHFQLVFRAGIEAKFILLVEISG